MSDGMIQAAVTLLAFASFLGICFYAYSPSRKTTFEHAATLPLLDDPETRS